MNTGLPEQRLIVFSDLDGTLLDHDTYEWSAAQPALEQLTFNNIPLILVSSKTFAELDGYRQQMRLEFPVVAENGAAIHLFGNEFPDDLVADGAVSRSELQAAYTDIKAAGGFNCEAFFELGVEGIVAETGLSPAQATLANERHATEPVRWRDSDERAAEFVAAAVERGLHSVRGGRFLHLMGSNSKEKAVQQLIDAWADRYAGEHVVSISLGDGPNDIGMLETTDVAVIIPGKHDHDMTLGTQNRILRAELPGPAGWNETMLELLAEY